MEENPDDPFRAQVPRYDYVLTYGGGQPVVDGYKAFGAQECIPIYNALDPLTHHPAPPDERFAGDARAFSATACRIARRGCTNFFCAPRRVA